MSCRFTALSGFILLFLRVQSIHLTRARSFSDLPPFEFPEIDGSPVDICRIFQVSTPDTATTTKATTTPTTTTTTTTPITRKVVATTKRPAVQSPPRRPETKNTGTPVRKQPAPIRPITHSRPNPANDLLYYLLANSRRRAAGSLNRFISRPIGGQPHRGHSKSDSDELAATLLRRVGRKEGNRGKIGSLSSEDSSDES